MQSTIQIGYWPGALALQFVIHKHRHASQPLYLCFGALQPVYDKVHWHLFLGLLHVTMLLTSKYVTA